MQYFKHMTNMRHDLKIKRLIAKYGLEGYGLYNLIIESIVEGITTSNPLPQLEETCMDLADFYNIDTYKAEEIVKFCIQSELFEQNEITGKILCSKIYKFLEQSQTRSNEIRKLITEYKNFDEKIDKVYVMKNGDKYKIGKSLYPEKRLSEVSKQMPGETILLMYKNTENGYSLENELHKLFHEKRIIKEWFKLDDDDLNILKNDYEFSVYDITWTEVKEKEQEKEQEQEQNKKSKFIPPTKQQIQQYVIEKDLNVDVDFFYNYFTTGNWYDSNNNKVKNWKQKLITWHNHNHTKKQDYNQIPDQAEIERQRKKYVDKN